MQEKDERQFFISLLNIGFCCYCCWPISHFRHKHIELIKNNSKIIYNFLRVILIFIHFGFVWLCVRMSISFHSLAEWNATDEQLRKSTDHVQVIVYVLMFFCLRLYVVCDMRKYFFSLFF